MLSSWKHSACHRTEGNNQAGKGRVLRNAGRRWEEAECPPLIGDPGRQPAPAGSSIAAQSVVRRLPALVKMGLPLELLLYFQERYKKPDVAESSSCSALVAHCERTTAVVFFVAELHCQLI